jgi:hypothetical protein
MSEKEKQKDVAELKKEVDLIFNQSDLGEDYVDTLNKALVDTTDPIADIKKDIEILKSALVQKVEYQHNVTESKIKVVGNASVTKTGVLINISVIPMQGPGGVKLEAMAVIKPDDKNQPLVITNVFNMLE